MAHIKRAFSQLTRSLTDFALPSRCPACGVIIEGDDGFCLECWQQLDPLDQGCPLCGDPSISSVDSETLCGACLSNPPPFESMRAAVRYGDVARTVALRLKYGGRIGLARIIARAIARHMEGLDNALLVPVPLHRSRIWKRGYNQAGLIARSLVNDTTDRLNLELLVRSRATPYLRGMGARERAKNVRGAFSLAPEHRSEVLGRRIILVDDVYTSGATVRACALVLKRFGAAEVHVRCWARVTSADDEVY